MPAGIIISGGASSLPGIDHLAEEIFNVPVRIYVPDFMSVRYPTFTNAIGLVITETNLSEVEEVILETVLEKTVSDQKARTTAQPRVKESNLNHQVEEVENTKPTVEIEEQEPMSKKLKNFFSSFFE